MLSVAWFSFTNTPLLIWRSLNSCKIFLTFGSTWLILWSVWENKKKISGVWRNDFLLQGHAPTDTNDKGYFGFGFYKEITGRLCSATSSDQLSFPPSVFLYIAFCSLEDLPSFGFIGLGGNAINAKFNVSKENAPSALRPRHALCGLGVFHGSFSSSRGFPEQGVRPLPC